MTVRRGTSTFPNGNRKISERWQDDVVEEGAIGDELIGGLVSVRG